MNTNIDSNDGSQEMPKTRNFASMTEEVNQLKAQFESKTISAAEFEILHTQLLQDINDYKYKKPRSLKLNKKQLLFGGLNVLASIFVIVGTIFTILPMESFGIAAFGIAIVIGIGKLLLAKELKTKNFTRFLILFAIVGAIIATGKMLLIEDTVEKDVQFEQTKIESEKESIKELEELEGL